MKAVVTSFSMSIRQASQIGEHLRGVKNRSAWIVDAIMKKINDEDKFSVADIPTRQLMGALLSREDSPDHLKVLLLNELNKN